MPCYWLHENIPVTMEKWCVEVENYEDVAKKNLAMKDIFSKILYLCVS